MNLRKRSSKNKTTTNSSIQYTINGPWQWVMERVGDESKSSIGYAMEERTHRSDLPSTTLLPPRTTAVATPSRRSRANKKKTRTSTMSLDVISTTTTTTKNGDNKAGEGDGVVLKSSHHGISAALDGLEDKDELVRTLQRCRIDHLGYAPPSQLIRWDITLSECQKMITELPLLQTQDTNTDNSTSFAVLKEPLSSQGKGIHFVSSTQEIYSIMENHRKNSSSDYLDEVIETKGRIPCWVLQAEIYPPMLIRDRKKFHIRLYVLVMETYEDDELLVDLYLYKRQEVRIASQSVDEEDQIRKPHAHITNCAFSTAIKEDGNNNDSKRVLISQVKELVPYIPALEFFCANTFLQLLPDITRRVGYTINDEPEKIQKHALAGIDIMMTESGKFYLLEVNANPGSPPSDDISPQFESHLVSFLTEMINLVVFGSQDKHNSSSNFVRLEDIVARAQNQQQQSSYKNNNGGR